MCYLSFRLHCYANALEYCLVEFELPLDKRRTMIFHQCSVGVVALSSMATFTIVNDWGKKYQKTEIKESIEFSSRNKEKYAWDNAKYEDDQLLIENDHTHTGTPADFPGIDIDNEDAGSAMYLLDDTDKERVLAAAKDTGITTRV